MSKGTIAVCVMSVFLCTLLTFATVELRRISASVVALQDKLGRPDPAGASTTPTDASKNDGTTSKAPTPNGIAVSSEERILAEIAGLREELKRAGGTSINTGPDGVTIGGGNPGKPMATDDLTKAFQEALAAKDKSDKEKQAKQYRKQMVVSAKSWAESLGKQLGLTEQQKQKMADIFADGWTRMNAGWNGSSVDEDAEPVDYTKIQNEINEKVKEMLTTEQAAKYDEMMKKNNWGGSVESDSAETDK